MPILGDDAATLDGSLRELAARSLTPLRQQGIKSAAITYVFHNSSRETPFSNFIKRKLTTQLLLEAGVDINLIDRQDFKLQQDEQSFSFMFTPNGTAPTDPEPVGAILVGELISSPSASEFLIHLRAIDLKTTRLLSASSTTVKIDTTIAERLGVSEIDLPGLPPLPNLVSDMTSVTSSLAAGFKPEQVMCSLEDPVNLDEGDKFLQRLTRAYLTSGLVENGWQILERELFYLVDRDQSATGGKSENYLTGDVILSLSSDDSAPSNSPTFFVKAIQANNSRLVGQAEISFKGLATTHSQEPPGNSTTGSPMGGGNQSLADALRRAQEKSSVAKNDPLVFSSSTILGEKLKPKPETLSRIGTASNSSESVPWLFELRGSHLSSFQWWYKSPYNSEKPQRSSEKSKMIEETLFRLNAIESGDLAAVKADLTVFLLWGYGYKIENPNEGSGVALHIGPLVDVATEIYTTYSLFPDGRPCPREWLSILGHNNSSAFADRLLLSLHPNGNQDLERDNRTPFAFPSGSYRFNSNENGALGHVDNIDQNVAFDYNFETVWKEVFPTTIKATIDLTPMKDHLYKIRK